MIKLDDILLGSASAKLLNGARQRFSGPVQARECGDIAGKTDGRGLQLSRPCENRSTARRASDDGPFRVDGASWISKNCTTDQDANLRVEDPFPNGEKTIRSHCDLCAKKADFSTRWSAICGKENARGPSKTTAESSLLAPRAGFEPATIRLTVECSTAELPRNEAKRRSLAERITKPFALAKHQLRPLSSAEHCVRGQTPCCVLTYLVPKMPPSLS
jgi:hypothetical protein